MDGTSKLSMADDKYAAPLLIVFHLQKSLSQQGKMSSQFTNHLGQPLPGNDIELPITW